MVQNIRENEKQSDGSYITKHRETNAEIVLYNTGEMNEDGSPVQTNVQKEIDDLKDSTSNIPNVGTNDQTPTYTESGTLVKLTSGEKLSVAFGKISKAITDLITHLADNVKHITSTERSNWNAAKTHADSAHAPSNAQANVIEAVKVNGTALTPSSKAVDITVPSVGNGTITITQNGTTKGTFTTNQSGNTTIALTDTDTNTTYSDVTTSVSGLMSSTDKIKLDSIAEGANKTVVDSSLSSTSTNPVQNKVVNSALGGKVPTTRTVNGKALSSNITLSASDVGADASGAASNALSSAKSYSDTNLATAKSYTDTKVANLVGTAPETMDTLEELASVIETHQNVTDALNSAIGNKVDKVSGKGLSTNDYTTTEKNKLSSITTGAEVNQNAFSNVVVGSTTIAADSKTDTLTFVEGSNVTITPDATNDKITIAATDTKYTHPAYTAKDSGLYKVTVDETGHVSATTAVTKSDITSLGIPASDTNTHYTSKNVVGSSTATSNTTSALTNGNVYLNSVENGAVTSAHKISGSGATTVTTDTSGNIIISSTDTNTTYSAATTSSAGLMSSSDKSKLNSVESGANKYILPTASSTLGGVKTTSNVTDPTDYTPCPIVEGVPYYKEGSGSSTDFASNNILIPVDHTLFSINEETQRYEQIISVDGMTEGLGGTFDILRSGAVLTDQESLIVANITDIVRQNGSIVIKCLEQPTANYTLVLYGTYPQATDETTLIANMNGWFTRVEDLESEVESLNNNLQDVSANLKEISEISVSSSKIDTTYIKIIKTPIGISVFGNEKYINNVYVTDSGIPDRATNNQAMTGLCSYGVVYSFDGNPLELPEDGKICFNVYIPWYDSAIRYAISCGFRFNLSENKTERVLYGPISIGTKIEASGNFIPHYAEFYPKYI